MNPKLRQVVGLYQYIPHNNYYITVGNGMFKKTFQLHLDPDEILTESKRL